MTDEWQEAVMEYAQEEAMRKEKALSFIERQLPHAVGPHGADLVAIRNILMGVGE